MIRFLTILLLSAITCLAALPSGRKADLVKCTIRNGTMGFYNPVVPLITNDLIVNGTTLTIAANATYDYNNIILTNGGILQIANTNVLDWTIINCNKLKVYSGSVINGGYFTKWDQSSPTVTKTAPDGTALSAVFQPHSINISGAGGAGGAAGGGGPPNYSTEFDGASGGDGYCDYTSDTLLGGTAGTVSNSGDGGWGQVFTFNTTTCGYFLNGSGGGGGRAGYSGEFIYLNVKQYFEPSIDIIVQVDGENGYTGGYSGDCNFNALDYAYVGNGGGGGAGGNGGALVVRKPTGATISCSAGGNYGGSGGGTGSYDFNFTCLDFGSGSWGEDGTEGIAGSLTFLNSL